MSHHSRVVWDNVPQRVRDELSLRERPKVGDTAIVDAAPGERWYFRRTAHGWNHVSTDRSSSNDRIAPDLTPEQKAEALAQVEAVERAMRERFSTRPATAGAECVSADRDDIARWCRHFIDQIRVWRPITHPSEAEYLARVVREIRGPWAVMFEGVSYYDPDLVETAKTDDGLCMFRLNGLFSPRHPSLMP